MERIIEDGNSKIHSVALGVHVNKARDGTRRVEETIGEHVGVDLLASDEVLMEKPMLEEVSTVPENLSAGTGNGEQQVSGDGDGGGVVGSVSVGFGEEERVGAEEGERNWLGNRWPQQETLALLKIRSDMDVTFRDANLKAPLWEDVSRKMRELGYNRSAKKCKEKFENIYKYHKRTKDGRSGRPNGKAYRFFEQLEALENHPFDPHPPSPSRGQVKTSTVETITSPTDVIHDAIPCSIHHPNMNLVDNSTSSSSSSGNESEDKKKKKRKMADFFGRLMKEVIDKQEDLQRQFIETLERCERDRMAREEAWKIQELERIRRERELLVQERSIAAAKDAAVLAFLKKFSEQADPVQLAENSMIAERVTDKQGMSNGESPGQMCLDKQEKHNGGSFMQLSSSRWPKDEVQALIRLRTNLDLQYEENGPKGPLWEEISTAMKKLGYNRSAKRCKEKWENINKYFKRVKESNKKRPEDSKTCPYFHQLDALYNKKTKKVDNSGNSGCDVRPEELLMHMMEGQQRLDSTMEDGESENFGQRHEEDNENEDGSGDGNQILAGDHSQMTAGNSSQSAADNPS
ncbi:hypothetical protein FEM48_Zijuj08G0183800 [Ziziphus jujuba var. spinosa]|uniref:Myb-like domain-containing protein n=1 Tax=Ziziphus jujuba var. spinosa TaxID=714518 RepID=A0A978V0M8_ZIZJJ|nr:hypothetical protein FEM48_Zijuj08G0183800 [Ziziphus jujuba var. spinosa]